MDFSSVNLPIQSWRYMNYLEKPPASDYTGTGTCYGSWQNNQTLLTVKSQTLAYALALDWKQNQPPFMNAGLELQCSQFWCAAEAAAISPAEMWYGLGNSSAKQKSCLFLCGLQRVQLTELVCTEILCKNSQRYTWTLKAVDFCPFAKTRPER